MFVDHTKGQLIRYLTTDVTIYSVLVIGSRLGMFILLPVYFAYLTPADFGVIGIITVSQSALIPLLGLGLHDAVQRFYPGWSIQERKEGLGTVWITVFIWGLILCTTLSYGHHLFNLIFQKVDSIPFFLIGLWTAFFMTLIALSLAVFRIRGELRPYSYITAGIFLTQSAISILLVSLMEMGAQGYLLGFLTGAACWALYLSVIYWREALPIWQLIKLKELLSYSIPMIPTTIIDGTVSLFDRFFLDKYVPLGTIGFYNISNQFAALVGVINQGMKSAWFPFLYRIIHDRKDSPLIISHFSFYYVGILMPPSLLVGLLCPEVIVIFDQRYLESSKFIPWLVLSVYIQSVTSAMGRGMDLAKKNGLWPAISIAHVVISLLALSYFVPLHGAIGAAWSIVLATCARALIQITLAHRAYPRPILGRRLLILWSMGLLMFWFGMQLEFDNFTASVLAKIALVALGSMATAILVLDREELQGLRLFLVGKLRNTR